jgi:hypothetical protein
VRGDSICPIRATHASISHLVCGYVVEALQTFVPAEVLPRRLPAWHLLGYQNRNRPLIGQQVKIALIEPKDLSEPTHDFFRRMTSAGFEMPDVGGRCPDSARNFLLSQLALTAAFANNQPEVTFLAPCHLNDDSGQVINATLSAT